MKNGTIRKVLSILSALIIVLSVLPLTAINTFAKTSGDWEYTAYNGEATIEGYNGRDTVIVIPSTLDGNSVTSIGDGAFLECINLTSVTISEGVTSIGNGAFFLCKSLTSVTLPDSLTSIGESAFEDCASLASIIIPDSVTSIGSYAFSECHSLTSITLPDGITSISACALQKCKSLTSVTIPDSVTSIGGYAFENCISLTSVTLPDGVTTIGAGAFQKCTSLTSINIPDGVTVISAGAFSECSSLTSITIPDSVTSIGNSAFSSTGYYNNESNWENGVLYIGNHLIAANKNALGREYTVKDGTKTIAEYAFSGCASLTSITLPDSVTIIGACAFQKCTSLKNVTIPDSVTIIGNVAFEKCTMLKSVTVPDSVKTIGACAFWGCSSLKNVTIGNGVTNIGLEAFFKCSSLNSVIIPDSVISIGNRAFGFFEEASDYVVNNGFVIFGHTGSAAETYANENGILFKAVDDLKPVSFADVTVSAWYFDAAQYCATCGFIKGYQNGSFGPADQLKRQDFVVILARITGADLTPYENVQSTMPDVAKGSYYAASVNWAVANHIINGYNNGKFGVGDPITREQVCTILYRYMSSPAVTGADATLKSFKDASEISSFAKDALVWAIQNGVISGKNETTLAPTVTASRAEIATIVMRLDKAGMFA